VGVGVDVGVDGVDVGVDGVDVGVDGVDVEGVLFKIYFLS
jgi:hypothetical protein